MSGFSAQWLSLREEVDRCARSKLLVGHLKEIFKDRTSLRILDLGCGTGSNRRALLPALAPLTQDWIMVDHDPVLLEQAKEKAESFDAITFHQADLTSGIAPLLKEYQPDLVTAAAFFDLVSKDWIDAFAVNVTDFGAVFYTALTYDGREIWEPSHPLDEAMLEAFHAHQHGDKGFGPSAGPLATQHLLSAFGSRGYQVVTARSDWVLNRKTDESLMQELLKGSVHAIQETGRISKDQLDSWQKIHLNAASCRIGHLDCLAYPAKCSS